MIEKFKKINPIVFYIVFALFILAFSLTTDNYDYDLWARLIVGKYFFQTGQVLKQDFMSYAPTHPIIDHEWGSGVIFYFVQHYFSPLGLLILQDIVIFLIFVLIIKIIKLREVKTTSPYNLLFYIFSAWALLQIFVQLIRCQIFSFLFFTLFLYILELARKGKNKPLMVIPFVMIVWNNLHGGCVAGLGLIVLYIIGEMINKKPFKKYILALLLSFIVLPINPWGIEYLVFLINANTMQRQNILEWYNLFIPQYKYVFLEFKYFASVVLFAEIGYIIKAVKSKVFVFDATKYLIIAATIYLAIMHIKLIPFCVITLTIFLYDDFYSYFNFITRGTFNKIAEYKDITVYIFVVILISINLQKSSFEPFLDWYKFPVRAIEFIRINNLKGKLLNNFDFGSYAAYKLYPQNLIFMDGRYEEVYDNQIKIMLDEFMFGVDKNLEFLNTFPPDLILLYKGCAVYQSLLQNSNWAQVFVDERYALFVRKIDLKINYLVPTDDINYYKKTLFDTQIDFRGER